MTDKLNTIQPWYKRTYRWGQTNLTEIDPVHYDNKWWRNHWKNTAVQGIIVNAGGIITYYPSRFRVYKAKYLGDRDLLREIVSDAREEGLSVLARMDINRIDEEALKQHPEWASRKKNGDPYRVGDRYFTCINGSYYTDFIPQIFEELIERYQPDGFADNSWTGLTRKNICYCSECKEKYKRATGNELPEKADWHDHNYKQWIRWNYDIRVDLYNRFNQITTRFGGENCLWLGMARGEVIDQCEGFRDFYRLSKGAKIILFDSQRREQEGGFQVNAEMGKLLHEVAGWDVLIPESMAQYQASYKGQPTFRHSSKPGPEARMWMLEGFAGGIQPWWHHISAASDDWRQYSHTRETFNWHAENEKYLLNRQPVAQVALVWSQDNFDFYGQEELEEKVLLPWRGFREALIRRGIPYRVVHVNDLEKLEEEVQTLILPNLAALSAQQVQLIEKMAESGKNIIATGETGLYDENGNKQDDFRLAELLGVQHQNRYSGSSQPNSGDWDNWEHHSYLRITPSTKGFDYGPGQNKEGKTPGRHPVFNGFEGTDILPFGGRIEHVKATDASVLSVLIPPFPIYPPETSWMRQPESDLPGIVYRQHQSGAKIVCFAADIDRCFGRYYLPDHGNLLANTVEWTLGSNKAFSLKTNGVIDCHLYSQEEKLILHLINLSGEGFRRPPLHQILPVAGVTVEIGRQLIKSAGTVTSRVLGQKNIAFVNKNNSVQININEIKDHELLVIEA